jgi:hypothetical protein
MLIKDTQNPIIDFSNQAMNSQGAVNSVAEAVKRYSYPVKEVTFFNNGLKMNDTILIMKSFSKHYAKLQSLELSKNVLGYQGAAYLANTVVPQLKGI